ncbi:MAG: pitrilysin family protein [Bacteriovoracaceae bacterium]
MKIEQTVLKNSLPVLFINSPGATAATVQIWFRAGSSMEKAEKDFGIAHFLEHMFFKGTNTRPGAKIAKDVESIGGEINAFTSFDYTCYYINTPINHLNNTTSILLDMVSNPEFKNEDLLPEREVVFEEFRRSIDNPHQFNFFEIQKVCFNGTYAHPILGTEQSIKNFSREQLMEFRKNFYNLSNALFVVAGDLTENKDEIIKTIEQYQIPKGPTSQFSKFTLKDKDYCHIHEKDVRMCTITLLTKATSLSEDRAPAEDLAMNCLGHGETSILYKNLVLNATLANGVSASTMFLVDGGFHSIKIACPLENLNKVYNEFLITLKTIAQKGFNNSDVEKIKNQYIASKIYEKESLESYAFSLGQGFAQTGNIYADELFIERIRKTPTSAVNEALIEILKQSFSLELQIPKNSKKINIEKDLNKFFTTLKNFKAKLNPLKKANHPTLNSKFDSKVQVIELQKGLKLIYRQNTLTPTFVFYAYLKGGIAKETFASNGLYHLISSNLTKGHSSIKYETIKHYLENCSASLHGFTGKNAYGISMHGQSEHFTKLSEHFFGSLLNPDFPEKFITHEKKLIMRALENLKEDPVKLCFKSVNNLMFPNHPYSLNTFGNEKSIKSLKASTVKKAHLKNINTQEMVLTYCGDLDLESLMHTISPFLKSVPLKKVTKLKAKKYKPQLNKKVFMEFNREQTQIFIGYPAYKFTDDNDLYLKMLTTHLSGQSSELFVEVRDRQGLCYSAQPIHFSALEGGYFGIYMASGFDKTDRAITAINKILTNLAEKGLPKDEFEQIKTMIEGQNQINIQTNEDYANLYSVFVLQNLALDFNHNINQKIKDLSHAKFNAFLKRFLSQKQNVVIVGRKVEDTKS